MGCVRESEHRYLSFDPGAVEIVIHAGGQARPDVLLHADDEENKNHYHYHEQPSEKSEVYKKQKHSCDRRLRKQKDGFSTIYTHARTAAPSCCVSRTRIRPALPKT